VRRCWKLLLDATGELASGREVRIRRQLSRLSNHPRELEQRSCGLPRVSAIDAQWLDRESVHGAGVRGAAAVRGVGRVGCSPPARPCEEQTLAVSAELVLEGLLNGADAMVVLPALVWSGGRWMSGVRDRIIAETRGNRWRCLELPLGVDYRLSWLLGGFGFFLLRPMPLA